MKRHPSLHPLSEHHHHALVQALEIARAARLAEGPDRHERLQHAAESLLHFWELAGRTHFREEEDQLLPALARHVRLDQEPAVMRMLADHAQIRAALQDLKKALAEHCIDDAQVARVGQLLHDHVRLEEDVVFPRAESLLSEQELAALKPLLTYLHEK